MKRSLIVLLSLILNVSFFMLNSYGADVTLELSDDASALVVNVPAGRLTGCRLQLAYDTANQYALADKGITTNSWTALHEVVAAIPAEGGEYSVPLATLGVPANAYFRLFASGSVTYLDYAWIKAANAYVNTGIKDTDVYGFELGLCPTDTTATYPFVFGSLAGSSAGVSIQHNNGSAHSYGGAYFSRWTESKYTYGNPLNFNTSQMNDLVFRNNSLTFRGTAQTATTGAKKWVTSPVGPSGHNLNLGRLDGASTTLAYTKWYYVKFYNQAGSLSLDYVPASVNNVAGFIDRVSGNFVQSTGTDPLVAGTETTTASNMTFTVGGLKTFYPVVKTPATVTRTDNTLTVTVAPGYATGEKLYLAVDTSDCGDTLANWARRDVIAQSIPAAGDTYVIDLAEHGVTATSCFRVFVGDVYTLYDKVQQNAAAAYINTGVRDILCYATDFEYYCTGYNDGNQYASILCSNWPGNGVQGFTFCLAGNTGSWHLLQCVNNTYTYHNPYLAASTTAANHVVFRNNTLTMNGANMAANTGAGTWNSNPVGLSGKCILAGAKNQDGTVGTRGWWFSLKIYGKDDQLFIDYVPVAKGGTVGFYDRVSGKFVTSTGGAALNAGTATATNVDYGLPLAPTMYDELVPVTAEWKGGLNGAFDSTANWTCRNAVGDELLDTLPIAGTTTAIFTGTVGFNMTSSSQIRWRTANFENCKLGADCTWSIDFGFAGTIDLDGHTLTLAALPAQGEITDTSSGDPGTVRLEVPANTTVDAADAILSGNLKIVKAGAGVFLYNNSGNTFTGGLDITAGTVKAGNTYAGHIPQITVTVRSGAVFDLNGFAAWIKAGNCRFVLDGGTLTNTSTETAYDGWAWVDDVTLTADSTFGATHIWRYYSGGGAANTLDLGGHKLTMNLNAYFYLNNTTVVNGTLAINSLNWVYIDIGDCNSPTSDWEINAPITLNRNLTVRNYTALYEGNFNGGSSKMKVNGVFTPTASKFIGCQLQNGASIDLSSKNAPWSTTCNFASGGNATVTFAENSTITVTTGARVLHSNERVISWTTQPADTVAFQPQANLLSALKFESRADGLYARYKQGIVIICR